MNRYELGELLAFSLLVFVALCAIVVPIFVIGRWYDSEQCETYKEVTGKDTTYRRGMCFIKDGDKWYAWSEYKLRNATTGVK